MKIALAGLAGVGAAWLLPRGGEAPAPTPSVTPSDRPGVTAVQLQLSSIPEGVSFHLIDGVRVFLVRTANKVVAFQGLAPGTGESPVWWCRRGGFESDSSRFDKSGRFYIGSAGRDLDRIQVQVTSELVTVFPRTVVRGTSRPVSGPPPPLPAPCPESERVG